MAFITLNFGPVTNNYNFGQEPPPEKRAVNQPEKKGGSFATGWDILVGTLFTLWQADHNGWMMAGLVHALIWTGLSAGTAPVVAGIMIAFAVCAVPAVIRWLYSK
ncbi:hypothetical protein ACP3TG_29035 [Phytobacter diazotrophicus]